MNVSETPAEEQSTPDQRSRETRIVFHAAIFVACFAILYSRRPDAILHAQFYAEDGARWYRDAYELGWRSLLIPETGYLQTVSRLAAFFALLFPFGWAPLVMNLCALAVQILPVPIMLSRRFGEVPLTARAAGCALYLGMPNSIEVHANTTNIQWHLALICLLVVLGTPAQSRLGRIFEIAALGLLSVDSPLGFVLAPIAALRWWLSREPRIRLYLATLIPGCIVQALVLIFATTHGREATNVGASLARFTGIVGGQIFFSAVAGVRTLAMLFLGGNQDALQRTQLAAMIVGLGMTFYGLWRSPVAVKLGLLFAAAVLAMALVHPVAGPDLSFPQWEYLQIPGRSSRYYFFPILAFYAALLSLGISGKRGSGMERLDRILSHVAVGILLVVPLGVYRDWKYPKYPDLGFAKYAAEFERAKPGTTLKIPIVPLGWEMELVKH
jgi:hypothetical protein